MIYAAITVLIISADFLVKYFIKTNVALGEVFASVGAVADFTYVQNKGAAFSMLYGRVSLLSVVSIAFCIGVVIFWIVKKPEKPLLCTAISLMFAGAAGNAIDRIIYGHVVDFISLKFMHFPVFNIADMAITIGAALIILYTFLFDKDTNKV